MVELRDVNLGSQPIVLKISTQNCYLCQKKNGDWFLLVYGGQVGKKEI